MNKKEMAKNGTIRTRNRQKEAFLMSLGAGESISDSCKAANLGRTTIWSWRKKWKGFDNRILAIIDSRTQTVEDALYATALKGNVIAQIFWLKNRAKDRWRDRFEHDITEKKVIVIGAKEKKERENAEK